MSRFIPEGVAETSQIFLRETHILQKLLATRNTADVTGGKPIAILSQSVSGVSAINPLVAFYDIHEKRGEVLFFCSVPDTTRDIEYLFIYSFVRENTISRTNYVLKNVKLNQKQDKETRIERNNL
jgi:hypothetical protein